MATKTSSFGTGKREAHDSSAYYERQLAVIEETKDDTVSPTTSAVWDKLHVQSAESMDQLPDNSVALMVTSPPYHVGKDYDSDATFEEYLDMLEAVFAETYRVLQPGGRAVVNVANLGRRPYVPLSDLVTERMLKIGYYMRGEIIWQKAKGASGSCAWGSFQSPANPVIRDLHEYCLCFSKGRFDRVVKGKATISRDEFLDGTLSVWDIPPESATRVNHPAPFPVELPKRFVELYTYEQELVLDPFMGSGTTGVAAVQTKRHWVGYEINSQWAKAARQRINAAIKDLKDREMFIKSPADFQSRATREGRRAQEIAQWTLEDCGFSHIERNVDLQDIGVTMNFIADDGSGCKWFFDVSGAFTSVRAGLSRTDTIWKTLGRALVLSLNRRGPIVFLTTDLPKLGSSGDIALRATRGNAFFDAIEMQSEQGRARLRQYAEHGPRNKALPGFWTPEELYGSESVAPNSIGASISAPLFLTGDPFGPLAPMDKQSRNPFRVTAFISSYTRTGSFVTTGSRQELLSRMKKLLTANADGFTTTTAQGPWVDPLSGMHDESVMVLEVLFRQQPSQDTVKAAAMLVLDELDQDTVTTILMDRLCLFSR